MNVLGYPERGVVNALLFEIAYSSSPTLRLQRLLDLAIFPFTQRPAPIERVVALVEQSLSDFGDADAILLLDHTAAKSAVFVEAKVKPSGIAEWRIQDEFETFRKGLESRVSSSNLFTQLYHKVRFVDAATGDAHRLRAGVAFPPCSRKALRRIGSNPVVLRAVEKAMPYLQNAFYLGVVPDQKAHLEAFMRDTLESFKPVGFDRWEVTRWGFLAWSDIKRFCESEGLEHVCEVLEFNNGQIY